MKNRMLSWVLALSLLLTMLPVSAMAAEDELAGDGLSVTESTQCTCGAEPDEAGVITHTDGCPLYEAPVCTCDAEPDEAGAVTHADGCPLYEAPVCTCGAEPDETGVITHAGGCPLYTEPVCTCGAKPDEAGVITHADGCPLYTEPEAEEPQGLTPEQEAAMLAGLEDAPELLTLEDIPLEVQTLSDRLGMAFINGETHPVSYLVTKDNENNAGTGTPDDDLDRYLYRRTNVHPIEVNITVPEGELPTQSCYIAVRTYDVNSSGQRYPIKAEYDILYVNDNPVGVLTGLDYNWNTSYYNVPLEYLKEGKNTIRVEMYNCPVYDNFTLVDFTDVETELKIERLNTESIWGVNIDWMQLVCDGGSRENVEEYSLTVTDARLSDSSVVVDVSTKIVTTSGGTFVTEYSIVNEAGHIIGSYQGKGVTGSETFSITMPKDAPSGTYTIRGLLKDGAGVILATDEKDFQYQNGELVLNPTLNFTLSPDTLTNGNVTIMAQVTDTHGCTDIEFLDGDTSAGDLCVERTVAANGTYTFTLSFTLDGEKKTQDYTVDVNNIDKAPPEIVVQPLTVLEDTPGDQVLVELKKAVSVTDNRGVDAITWPTAEELTALAWEPGDGKPVTVTARDQAGNTTTETVTVSVSPLPLELTIEEPVQNGDGFTLSATLNYTGGQTITESGFVWGSMQNPTTTVYSGKVATSGPVGKGGSFTANTGAIDKGINYYVRAYVVAGGETYYSSQMTFDIGAPQYGVVSIQNNGSNTFTVSRTDGTEGAQTVYYRTVNGSAVGGIHFTAASGTVTIPAGQSSATITIQGENAAAVYQSNAATAYANADRTYQVEIYRVEGGATIQDGVSRAESTLTVDSAYQVDKNIFNEYQATTPSGEVQRGDFDDDEIGWKLNQKGGSGAKETVSIAAILSGAPQEYYQAVMDHYTYQLSFRAKEDESGYQNIQIVEGDALDTSFGPKEDAWEGTWTTALYRAKFEHGGSKKNTEYAQYYFPNASGTNPSDCNLGENFRLDEFNANGAVVISKGTTSISVGFSGSGDGSDKWKTTALIHKLKVVDTQEPQLLGVATPTGTYLPGDQVTISLIFDEIVDSQNSSLNGSTIINTSWGAFTYAGGADTNVLYFTGTVGSSGGTLTVTGISNGTIKDMAGNGGSSISGAGNVDVDQDVPVVSIGSPTVAEDNSLLSADISATNATLLRYAWTDSAAMPTAWQTAGNTSGVTVSYRPEEAGPYWLHVQAFNSTNGGSDYKSQQFTLHTGEGGDPPVYVPPELTVAVDNNNPQWAKSRTITVERKPEGATVTYTGPGIAAPATVTGNTVTATANGLYTFTLTSGEEKLVKSVQVTGIDTQAPAITLTTPGDTDLVYNSLTFGGAVSDDASGVSKVEYVFSTSSTANGATGWQTAAAGSDGRYTFAYTATQTEQTTIYLHVRATDQAGNEKAITSQAYTVIKTPEESELPQITLTGAPTGWTKGPVTLTWTVTKPESGFTVQIEGGEASSSSTGTIQASRNGTYRVAVTDSNGNRAEASCEVAYIDTQPPVVGAVSVTPEGFAQKKTVSFAVSDTGSGVETVEYRLGSGDYATATADADGQYYFSVVADGSYEIRVTDQVGNSDTYSVQVRDIDTTGPTVTPGAIPEGWQMGDVTVSFTITDMESGVAEQQYIVTDSTSSPGSEAGWTAFPDNGQVTVTGNGQWYIHYKITDHAGNETTGHTSTPVKIDNETPTITVTGGETGASELTLSVTASFGGSGGMVSVQKDGGEAQDVTGTSYTAKEAGTYTFKATSSAGKTTEKTVNVYGITFDSAGGSDVSRQLAASGGTVTEPVKPTKDGYAFDGWYKEADCTTPWNFDSDEVTGSITLYAKWTPAAYSITYHLDGGTVSGNPETYTVETDSFTLNNPTRSGYTFAGWTGTGLDQATESITIVKGSTGDRTYTATWTANTYTVALDKNANDAAGEMTAQTFAYGQKRALTANAYTRTGYTFAGWNTAADGSGVKYSDQQEVENLSATDGATITLYAQWALEGLMVTITGAPEEPVTYGTEITLTATTTHTADGLTYTYQWYKGGAALPGKTESTLTLTDVADSGSYTVEVTAIDGSQSSKASSTSVEVEVIPLGIAVTWSGLTRVYGDNEPKVRAVLGGVLGSDACTLSAITYQQDGQQDGTPVTAPTNAGEYTVTVSLTGVDAVNYTLKNGTAALTIRPKAVGFTVSGNAVEGDGTAKAATVIPTDSALTQTGYTVTYRQGTVTVAAPTAAGSYEIWVEITDGNYQHTNGKTEMQVGTLTITQAPPVLYDVTFAGGADVTGSMTGLEAVGNSILTLPECAYSRTDHKFTGWLYNGKVYQPGDSFTMPARNVTFTAQWQAVFTVDGIVTEETDGEDTEVKNAVVSLWLGANKISEVTTGADGKFRFENLIPGIYNLVVTKDVRTVTSKVELTESKTCDAVLPKGATNSIVEVTPGSPDIVVGKLNTVFDSVDEKVYTAEDEKTVLAGGKVEITFTAEEKQKTEVSEDLQKIQAVSGESNLALVMDYRLDKVVFNPDGTLDTTASKAITQANVLLEVLLPLPAELQGKAGYAVYRVHDGQVQELTMTPSAGLGEYFTVSSDKTSLTMYVKCFSTYAVGYTESSGGNGGGSSGGGTSTPVYPPSIEEPEHGSVTIRPKKPEKGDQVTITPTPDEGYDVDTVVVTDSSGKEVAVTPNDDGTYTFVQPSGKVTIAVTFRQLNSVSDCPRDESCPMAPFIDADRDAWYHDGVHYCVEHGLMMGTSQTTFAPDIVTTRGMIVTILWRLEGSPIVDASLDFDDVKAEDWYGEAVRWADSVGVVTGYGNGKFGPNDTITREQMAAMLWRYAGSPKVDGTLASFTDGAQTSSWAQSAMIWAVEQGLIAGVGNDRLEPTGQATRAQAATILMRFAQNMAQ